MPVFTPPEKEAEACFIWDVVDPFAPPDPSQARLRALIQAEIERTRRYEAIGPLESLPPDPDQDDWYDWDSDSDFDDDDVDVDEGDADDEESASDSEHDDDHIIALPQLPPVALRFLPSPNPFHPPSPSSPPPRRRSSFSDTTAVDDKDTLWNERCNAMVEAEARAARKAKRDAYRSRLKALDPEAASALPPHIH